MESKTKYIFSINTGRSGSDYLSRIFEHVTNCKSLHEPNPSGNGKEMRCYAKGKISAMEKLTQKKIANIQEIMQNHQIYFESNHCFIKGFGWLIPNHIPQEQIGVIILKRDKHKIVESYMRIGCSPLSSLGRKWITTPDIKNPLIKPPSKRLKYKLYHIIKLTFKSARILATRFLKDKISYPNFLVKYELECLDWYVDETYANAEHFKKKYPKIKYYEVNVKDLNSLDKVRQMFAHFGCIEKNSLGDIVNKPTNLKVRASYNKKQ